VVLGCIGGTEGAGTEVVVGAGAGGKMGNGLNGLAGDVGIPSSRINNKSASVNGLSGNTSLEVIGGTLITPGDSSGSPYNE
jgi:hypothetical protein